MTVASRQYTQKSLYGDVALFQEEALLHDTIVLASDAEIEVLRLLEATTDWVEHYCDRVFFPWTRTLYFDGSGDNELLVPDLISITTIKHDTDGDLTYEETWDEAADIILAPYNADPTRHALGQPYTRLVIAPKGDHQKFTKGTRNFEIAGSWGYRDESQDSGQNVQDNPLSNSAATITVSSNGQLSVGMTLKIENEQVLVTSKSDTTIIGVTRAMNGTTAASHAQNTDIFIQRVPRAVERAALIQATRIWVRAPSFEPFFVSPFIDPDVRELLAGYRRPRT